MRLRRPLRPEPTAHAPPAIRIRAALGLGEFLVDEGLSEFMGETWFTAQPVHALTVHQHRASAAREGKTVPTFSKFAFDIEERVVAECTLGRWAEGPPSAPAPYPETLAACLDRYVTAFQRLADRHRGENVLLVSHGCARRSPHPDIAPSSPPHGPGTPTATPVTTSRP